MAQITSFTGTCANQLETQRVKTLEQQLSTMSLNTSDVSLKSLQGIYFQQFILEVKSLY
jgi:hypothetical protein